MDPLARLFGSPARLKVIRLFVFNKETSMNMSDVARRTKLSKETARREVLELLAGRLLRKKGTQTPALYQINPRFEYLEPLTMFIRETTTVRPQDMVKSLKRAGTLRLIVLTGLFSGAVDTQIDLLIVGDNLQERALANAVHSLEAELGREIRYASFATADFRYRLGVYDRLLRDVFDYPHRLLVDKIGL